MLELDKVELQQGGFSLSADLNVSAGDIIAVLGPSGAGKSTLLAAIAGFLPVSGGHIRWQGTEISELPPAQRPVSILFQDNNLFPHMTARENTGLGINPSLRLSADAWARVDAALKRVGLSGLDGRKPAELSGGQVARVSLARALVRAQPIMLLDEPFGALGPGLKAEMLGLVQDLAAEAKATVLMVSHDPEDALAIAQHIVWVEAGRADPPRETAEIFANPPPEMARYLGT